MSAVYFFTYLQTLNLFVTVSRLLFFIRCPVTDVLPRRSYRYMQDIVWNAVTSAVFFPVDWQCALSPQLPT